MGRRWGKTTLAIDQMKGRAAISGSRVVYIAPTYQQARDIAWAQLKTECRDAAAAINEARLEIKLVNDSIIILRGWEAVETLRGQAFDLVVIDEVAMMRNFWMNWQEVIRPTLTDRKGECLFISTPRGFNHFYDLYNLQEQDSDFKSFHFSTYDNPHVPAEEIDKASRELTPDRFAQEYMADFTKTEGLVYKEFRRETCVIEDIPKDAVISDVMGGVDFGYTNPCAAITIKKDKTDTFYIAQEYYQTKRTDAEVAKYVSKLGWAYAYPDPESPGAIEELKRAKIICRDVVKGKDSIENGIQDVRELLKAGKLKVLKQCVNTISEFETYSYPDKKDDRNEAEKPLDENNHAMDAIRYVIMMQTPPRPRKPYVQKPYETTMPFDRSVQSSAEDSEKPMRKPESWGPKTKFQQGGFESSFPVDIP